MISRLIRSNARGRSNRLMIKFPLIWFCKRLNSTIFPRSLTFNLQDKRQLCQCADALSPSLLTSENDIKGKWMKKLYSTNGDAQYRLFVSANLIDFLLSRAELPLKMNGNDLWCGIMFKQSKAQRNRRGFRIEYSVSRSTDNIYRWRSNSILKPWQSAFCATF